MNLKDCLDTLDDIRRLDEDGEHAEAHAKEDALTHTVLREIARAFAFTDYNKNAAQNAARNEAITMCCALVGHLNNPTTRWYS